MKVKELIKELKEFDGNLEVVIRQITQEKTESGIPYNLGVDTSPTIVFELGTYEDEDDIIVIQ